MPWRCGACYATTSDNTIKILVNERKVLRLLPKNEIAGLQGMHIFNCTRYSKIPKFQGFGQICSFIRGIFHFPMSLLILLFCKPFLISLGCSPFKWGVESQLSQSYSHRGPGSRYASQEVTLEIDSPAPAPLHSHSLSRELSQPRPQMLWSGEELPRSFLMPSPQSPWAWWNGCCCTPLRFGVAFYAAIPEMNPSCLCLLGPF